MAPTRLKLSFAVCAAIVIGWMSETARSCPLDPAHVLAFDEGIQTLQIADDPVTQAIAQDLDIIFSRWPILAQVCALPDFLMGAVEVETSESIASAYLNGEYAGFDGVTALLEPFEATLSKPGFLRFSFGYSLNPSAVRDLFRKLGDVISSDLISVNYPDDCGDVRILEEHLYQFANLPCDRGGFHPAGVWWVRVQDGTPILELGDAGPLATTQQSFSRLKALWR